MSPVTLPRGQGCAGLLGAVWKGSAGAVSPGAGAALNPCAELIAFRRSGLKVRAGLCKGPSGMASGVSFRRCLLCSGWFMFHRGQEL